jgi:hypothetical protein
MMRIRSLNRWQAAGSHFVFSALLGLLVFCLFRYVWYPDALFTLAGAGKLLLLVIGIDVVLGPLLTLIVFDPAKKSLVIDLSVIVAIQLSALAYGVWVMAQSRPVFLAGVVDRFELIMANDIRPEDLSLAASPEWQKLSWTGPVVVGAIPSSDLDERRAISLQAIAGGPDISRMPKFYVPLAQTADTLRENAQPLAAFEARHAHEVAAARRLLTRRGVAEQDVLILPLQTRMGVGALAVSRTDLLPVVSLGFDPLDAPTDERKP